MLNLKQINRTITALLARNIVFLGKEPQSLQVNRSKSSQFLPVSNDNASVVIVSKQYYREENKTYPIANKRELNKILSLEASSESELKIYRIGPDVDGERNVTFWIIQKSVLAPYKRLVAVIPETALLTDTHQGTVFERVSDNVSTWFYQNKDGKTFSASQSPILRDVQVFKASCGLSQDAEVTVLDDSTLINHIEALPATFWIQALKDFFTTSVNKSDVDLGKYARGLGITAALMLSVYLSATSAYLWLRSESLSTTIEESVEQTGELFSARKKIEAAQSELALIEDASAVVSASPEIWTVAVALMKSDVSLSSIGFLSGGRILIKGKAASGIKALETVKQEEHVIEAQFYSPTRRNKNLDDFSITFRLESQ